VLHSLLAFVALLLTGCTATVYTSYQIATDQ
jgi:outer membrane biogenesis lipoprotein LolB